MSNPPETVLQFIPSTNPMDEQVRGTIAFAETALPGYERYVAAMLPAGAAVESKCDVSYQFCAVVTDESGLVSQLKKANTLFFQTGPPRLAP